MGVVYCKNDRPCPADLSHTDPLAHPDVATATQLTPVDVPLYGRTPRNVTGIGTVSLMCTPLAPPTGQPVSTLPIGERGLLARNGSATNCSTASLQQAAVHTRAQLATRRMYHAGAISGSFYADRIAWATLQRSRSNEFIIAAEDVTGNPGFEMLIATAVADDEVSAVPAYSWQAAIRASNGTLPYETMTDGPRTSITLPTAAGDVQLTQAVYSPTVWRYLGGAGFGDGVFMFAIDSKRKQSTIRCEDTSFYNGYPLRVCDPNLSRRAFLDVVHGAVFQQHFVMGMGDRMWHVTIITAEGYAVPHTTSTFILAGGLVAAVLLGALSFGALTVRDQRLQQREAEAATKAHELTVSYACHELRNPLHALTAATALLGEGVSALEEALDDAVAHVRTVRRRGGEGEGRCICPSAVPCRLSSRVTCVSCRAVSRRAVAAAPVESSLYPPFLPPLSPSSICILAGALHGLWQRGGARRRHRRHPSGRSCQRGRQRHGIQRRLTVLV